MSTEEQRASVLRDEEEEWLPNPYQALADAQVRAGTWPGIEVLCCAPTPLSPAMQVQGMLVYPELAWPHLPQQPEQGWISESWEVAHAGPDAGWKVHVGSHMWHESCGADVGAKPGCDAEDPSEHSSLSTAAASEEHSLASDEEASGPSGCAGITGAGRSSSSAKRLSHASVPKVMDFGGKVQQDTKVRSKATAVTTLMVRNIPNAYTRDMFVEELGVLGFTGEYDFLYLPIDRSTQWNVGYAFVNFGTPEAAARCRAALAGYVFCCYPHGSGKVTQVSPANLQGLEDNLEFYSKTAVQCTGSEASRPLVLRGQEYVTATSRPVNKSSRRRRQRRTGFPQAGAEAAWYGQ